MQRGHSGPSPDSTIDRILESKTLRSIRNYFIRLRRDHEVSRPAPKFFVQDNLEPQFLLIGDFGTGDAHQYAVAKGLEKFCARDSCRFAVTTGDNFYEVGVRSPTSRAWQTKFERPYAKLDMPCFPSLGNPDHFGRSRAQVQRSVFASKWRMPAEYYSFRAGRGAAATELFAIDTEVLDAKQLQWLETSLASSKAPWKIVFGHHPIASSGPHGGTPELVERLLPLLRKFGVDAYLCGHDHHLEVLDSDGLLLALSGAAGKLRPLATEPKESLFAASAYGFMHVAVGEQALRLRVMDEDGTVLHDRSWPKKTTTEAAAQS
jgi:tartrate-resistant acid phosphatase type 5